MARTTRRSSKFLIRLEGANAAAARLGRARERLPTHVRAGIERAIEEGVVLYRDAAPEGKSGQLKDSIEGRWNRNSRVRSLGEGVIAADPVDPESGYHYIGVTRFGHRKAWIRPTRARMLVFPPSKGFVADGRGGLFYRRRVKGYKPETDWAQAPGEEMVRVVARISQEIGDQILTDAAR